MVNGIWEIKLPGCSDLLGGKQEQWLYDSGFQKWDKFKILLTVLAFMKSVFDLCFINDHPYLLNRIRSPAEHFLIIFY